jgi:Protein of unknown function (DUF3631)
MRLDPKRTVLSPLDRLMQIEPAVPEPRFSISWQPEDRKLWYGLGWGLTAVRVSSTRDLEDWHGNRASRAKISKDTVKLFLDGSVQPHGSRVLCECGKLLRRYIHFDDERVYALLAAWIVASYLYPVFSHFGYLFFHSELKRSGKTRTEKVLSHLAFEATAPLNAPTVPSMREMARNGGTLTLDTLERWKEKSSEAYAAAMELLDAGFRNGGKVAKMTQLEKGVWEKEEVPVFAPYILAGINRNSLTDTALDRSFVIEMHRKRQTVKKEKYNFNKCEKECQRIRESMYLWALGNAPAVAQAYDDLETEVDAMQLNDRAADIWRPLFAVVRTARAESLFAQLKSLAIEMARDPECAEDAKKLKIVRVLKGLTAGKCTGATMTTKLMKQLAASGVKIESPNHLHNLLAGWGFEQKSVRVKGNSPRRAWKIDTVRLEQLERELSLPSNADLKKPGERIPLAKSDYRLLQGH